MLLFVLSLNPLLEQLGRDVSCTYKTENSGPPEITYADDIMILLTSTSNIPKPQQILRQYERAIWALINTRK